MKNKILINLLISLVTVLFSTTSGKSQNYLSFESGYQRCGVAINFDGETAASPCQLLFTYDGTNLNFHFLTEDNDINMVTKNLKRDSVKLHEGEMYLANGVYYLSLITLKVGDQPKVSIEGDGKCEKSSGEIVCDFEDTQYDIVRFAGVAYKD